MAFTPKRKSFQRRSVVTLGDVTAYVWEQARSALGLQRPALEEEEGPTESHVSTHHRPTPCHLAPLQSSALGDLRGTLGSAPAPLRGLGFHSPSQRHSSLHSPHSPVAP